MFEIEFSQQTTKVKQLANAIQDAITIGEYPEGSSLPSINDLSKKCCVARDTVFKAFQSLKEAGIIESTPTKGYYVATSITQILVMFDIFSPYKNDMYHALTNNLPANYKVDLYFHHYNKKFFDNIIRDSIGKYNLYLIMNFSNDVYSNVLDELDSNRVLLIDFGNFEKNKYAYICQGFDNALYDCLMSGADLFKKYRKLTLVFPESSEHPRSCIPYFEKFCLDNGLDHALLTRENILEADVDVHAAYLIVRHSDLIDFTKICRKKGLVMGRDVGVVTFNDAPMLEVIENGITTISTDFKQMGSQAAEFIRTKQKIQTYISTKLIVRGSL
ncbi:MAG: transcriptional regulator, FucR [Bacteroidetes bacterium]|jgi:DNA-binding transcriptional regulator YhcF (GntR family)|nr:transcriptional regulator, FucR [Bacteroidota bacterium]